MKRSTNGLNSTDICKILEAAAKAGVKHFAFGDLEFVLGGENIALTPASMLYHSQVQKPVEIARNMADNDDDGDTEEHEVVDLDELALTDPVAYEKAVLQEEE